MLRESINTEAVLQYNTIQYNTIQYNTTQHNTILYLPMQHLIKRNKNSLKHVHVKRMERIKLNLPNKSNKNILMKIYLHIYYINLY